MLDLNVSKVLKQAASFDMDAEQIFNLQTLLYQATAEQLESLMAYLAKYDEASWNEGYDDCVIDAGFVQKTAAAMQG